MLYYINVSVSTTKNAEDKILIWQHKCKTVRQYKKIGILFGMRTSI